MKKKTWYDLFIFLFDLCLTGVVIYLIWNGALLKGFSLLALKAIVFVIGRIIRLGDKDEPVEPSEDDISEEV